MHVRVHERSFSLPFPVSGSLGQRIPPHVVSMKIPAIIRPSCTRLTHLQICLVGTPLFHVLVFAFCPRFPNPAAPVAA